MTRSRIFVFLMSLLLAATTTSLAGEVESLRGATALDAASSEPARTRYLDEEEPFPRAFEEQPPLVPHPTARYGINLEENRCLECHSWADAEEADATRVPESHFPDDKGGISAVISGEQYFCNQCHVAQVGVEPLVENTFESE